MPEQTITLAVADLFTDTASQKQWRVSVQLDADFEPGATDRYLRRIQARNDQGASGFRYRLFFDETGVAPQTETASDLVDDWETADVAMTFTQGSNTLDVPGPDNAGNELRDSGDNYVWDPPVAHVPFAGDFFFSLFDTSADLTVTFKFPGPDTSPTLAPVADQSATIGVPFSLTLDEATDGNAPLIYMATPLPAGIAFSAATRVMSGTPTTAGTTTVTYSVEDDDGDTDSVTFSFAIAALVVTPDYTLEVDWDNDGTYGNAEADVWPRLIANTFNCRRGRNFASQLLGRSVAGALDCVLDNKDGLFDPENSNSALNGLLGGGRRVRWRMDDGAGTLVTQWTGWLDKIDQDDKLTGLDQVRLRALGVLSRLNNRIHRDQVTNTTVGAAAKLIFDPDGSIGVADAVVDGVDYRASYIKGDREIARWWEEGQFRGNALKELEETEGGFLWEPKDGFIALDASTRRTGVASRVSQVTFTDEHPLTGEVPVLANGIKADHPLQSVANRITSQVRTYGVGAQQVLWSVTGLTIPANDSITINVVYPYDGVTAQHVGVEDWRDLQAGVDYTAHANLTVTMDTEGNEATVTIANSGSERSFDLQIRGTPVVVNNPIQLRTDDQDSIDEYGVLPFPFDPEWLSNIAAVQDTHGFYLRIYSQPDERLTLRWEAGSDLEKATGLDLSDRVTVKRREGETDYYLESIAHRVTLPFHYVAMTLSPAGRYGSVTVLDVGPPLGEGIYAP